MKDAKVNLNEFQSGVLEEVRTKLETALEKLIKKNCNYPAKKFEYRGYNILAQCGCDQGEGRWVAVYLNSEKVAGARYDDEINEAIIECADVTELAIDKKEKEKQK